MRVLHVSLFITAVWGCADILPIFEQKCPFKAVYIHIIEKMPTSARRRIHLSNKVQLWDCIKVIKCNALDDWWVGASLYKKI